MVGNHFEVDLLLCFPGKDMNGILFGIIMHASCMFHKVLFGKVETSSSI